MMLARRAWPRAVIAGALIALSMTPWGWWPLAWLGIALWDRLLVERSGRGRWWLSWLVGAVWFLASSMWMLWLTVIGWIALSVLNGAFVALCGLLAGRARRVALPAAVVAVEWLRWHVPFGGDPLSSLALGQIGGPFGGTARVIGALGLCGLTVVVGQLAGALRATLRPWATGCWRDTSPALLSGPALIITLLVFASLAPRGHTMGSIRVALVQGGGPQGTRAVLGGDEERRKVFDRHMRTSGEIDPGSVDLVVWPENTTNLNGAFETSVQRRALTALAARLGSAISVGIVEDEHDTGAPVGAGTVPRFRNAQVVIGVDGQTVARYDKVKRVPFGEYVPLRSLLDVVGVSFDLVPQDALVGSGPPVLDTAFGSIGVAISWEDFFPDLARSAVNNGAALLLNPTNGASYETTIVQSQQLASSRLRAIESGRWVAQVAPTGFTAFVGPDGGVHDRTEVGEAVVIHRTVALRRGKTIYGRIGDRVLALVASAVLVLATRRPARTDQRSRGQHKRRTTGR
jgi:apolipoprotein N-acyltransferase